MITSVVPDTWQALQTEVGKLLTERGFAVEVEKTMASARGEIEIDVYAVENVRRRRYSIACECKHWQRPIPQTVVHAFRTVVSEIGANVGYIISMAGFQSGSFRARFC
ncbi:restriction endonuclease [Candidatus Methylospira mobilis]|uniref:Restriction endonuclease n=1 Tax=Candidatus Methylospira mobilis TaxID=1808979 RepID=A0A5Q0BJH0_9GAMM|nr:restriction endonuclease [Candidatus Methylospira mobilis]